MCVIKETNPFELNPLIDPILLKYSITNFIDKEGRLYLTASPQEADNTKIIDNLTKWLTILRKYRYIKNFNKVIHINWKYREIGWTNTYKDLSQYLNFPTERRVISVIRFDKDISKWNFLKEFRENTNSNLDNKIDNEKINQIITWYSVWNEWILWIIDKLRLEYSKYFPDRKDIDEISLKDFLYFYSYNFKDDFNNISLSFSRNISFDEKRGDVYINKNIIWNIKPWNREYKFFLYLYQDKWTFKKHKDIMNYITSNEAKNKTADSFCSDIKRILGKEVRSLIEGNKWWYRIP